MINKSLIIGILAISTLSLSFSKDIQFQLQNKDSIKEALEQLAYTNNGVYWDGANERFVYKDSKLKQNIYFIAEALLRDQETVIASLKESPKQVINIISKNTNTVDIRSRTEPFDLIQGAITEKIMKLQGDLILRHGGSRIFVSTLIHRKLHLLFGSNEDINNVGHSLSSFNLLNDRSNRNILIFCADKKNVFKNENYILGEKISKSLTSFLQIIPMDVDDIKNDTRKINLTCNDITYILNTKIASALQPPKPYNSTIYSNKNPLNVLVTFAIIDKLEKSNFNKLIAFMQYAGYQYDGQEVVESTSIFSKLFQESDLFIPSAHDLNINLFDIGKEYSQKIQFSKNIVTQNALVVPVKITMLFPAHGNLLRLHNSTEFFPKLLIMRSELKTNPLFVIQASCYSYVNINSWIGFYRIALDSLYNKDLQKALKFTNDMPYVIGSNSSFSTKNIMDIKKLFSTYLAATEVIALGGNPNDIYRELDDHDRTNKFFDVFEKWYKLTSNNPEINPFKPI
ncbi:hypothetical protein STA3757_02570 [Stanieria sp. NIES-3757]|nr:hypothetical protein STA3757_02570 [Stanieria sp. NIES-3757]